MVVLKTKTPKTKTEDPLEKEDPRKQRPTWKQRPSKMKTQKFFCINSQSANTGIGRCVCIKSFSVVQLKTLLVQLETVHAQVPCKCCLTHRILRLGVLNFLEIWAWLCCYVHEVVLYTKFEYKLSCFSVYDTISIPHC